VPGRLPAFGRLVLLPAAMPVDTAVGVVYMLAPHELFPAYARAGRTWGPGLVLDAYNAYLSALGDPAGGRAPRAGLSCLERPDLSQQPG
jgi:hypothetical protein